MICPKCNTPTITIDGTTTLCCGTWLLASDLDANIVPFNQTMEVNKLVCSKCGDEFTASFKRKEPVCYDCQYKAKLARQATYGRRKREVMASV